MMKGNSSWSCWSLVDRAKADAYDVQTEGSDEEGNGDGCERDSKKALESVPYLTSGTKPRNQR